MNVDDAQDKSAALALRAHEEQLLVAARMGDHDAFTSLCEKHSRRLYQAILRITRNQEDAEDVLQDALLRAYLHLNSFDGRSQFSTWLIRVGINSALGLLRRKRVRPQVSLDDEGIFHGMGEDALPDIRDNTEHDCMKQEQLQYLRCIVMQLRPKLRDALLMHHAQDCSVRDLAFQLGMSEGAVKSLLLRGRREVIRSWHARKLG